MDNRIWGILAIGAACSAAGCAASNASGGASDNGSGGGAGLTGDGGAFSLPSQGAVTLSVERSTSPANGRTCPDPGTTYPAGDPAPTNTNPGGSLVDGDRGAQVSCAVQGTGSFTFSGSLDATTSDKGYPIRVDFTEGQVGADLDGTAHVSIYTPKLGGSFVGQACTVQVIAKQIKGGAMWASFSCPTLALLPSGLCAASGVFVFENCLGS
jgi:hypothetical protein